MNAQKHAKWSRQFDSLAHEISKLCIACDIEIFEPGTAVKVIKNDTSVCRRDNPDAFRKLREHLMALFPLEEAAIEKLGADDTKEMIDGIRDAIINLRNAGKPAG